MEHQIVKSVEVQCTPQAAFDAWLRLERFTERSRRVRSVTRTGDRTSRWTVDGPFGKDVSWDVETTMIEPGKRVAWNTRLGGDVTTSGQATFSPLPGGRTEVAVRMRLKSNDGALADVLAKVLSDPEKAVEEALESFRTEMETTARTRRGGAVL
jgi:uncharacterized membrane protein